MKYSLTNLLLLLLLTASISTSALASEIPLLRVVTEDTYPLNYLDENNSVAGYATQHLKEVLKQSKVQYNIAVLPWERAFQLASAKPNVLIYSIARTSDRESNFIWLYEMLSIEYRLYSLQKEDNKQPLELSNLKQEAIAVVSGDISHKKLITLGFTNLIIAHSYPQLHQLLTKGRAKYLISSRIGMQFFYQHFNLPLNELTEYKITPEFKTNLYYALSKGSDKTLEKQLFESFDSLKHSPTALGLHDLGKSEHPQYSIGLRQ